MATRKITQPIGRTSSAEVRFAMKGAARLAATLAAEKGSSTSPATTTEDPKP
jgi:hypothetical protein